MNGRVHGASLQASDSEAKTYLPWVLLSLLGLYLAWALFDRHEKIRGLIQPRNLALNLRSLAAITLQVVLALALARIALIKFKVIISGLGGTFGAVANGVVGALIRLVP